MKTIKSITCKKCAIEKPISEFYIQRTADDGEVQYRKRCKTCVCTFEKNKRDLTEADKFANAKTISQKEIWKEDRINKIMANLSLLDIERKKIMSKIKDLTNQLIFNLK